MKDYLKTKTVELKTIGDSLVIKQLSHAATAEFLAMGRDETTRHMAGCVALKYGVPDWKDMTPEDISGMLSPEQVDEIVGAIFDLGGLAKNSESIPTDSSSST